jgi:hypothetical protein
MTGRMLQISGAAGTGQMSAGRSATTWGGTPLSCRTQSMAHARALGLLD